MRQAVAVRAVDMLTALSTVDNAVEFRTIVLRDSAALLHADRSSATVIRHDGTTAENIAWPRQPPVAMERVWEQRHEEHPSLAGMRRAPLVCHRLSEQLSLLELRRLPIYSTFMKPMGSRDQLTIALQSDERRLTAVTLVRVGSTFTDNDRLLLQQLAAPIRHLYTAMRARHSARLLTEQQKRLLTLVADGHTDAAIARRLGVSQRTVEKHLESVRARLNATSRPAAVAAWLGW